MIPLVDDYLQGMIASKLSWLKTNPDVIDHIFFACRRSTLAKLKQFVTTQQLRVIIGFPRDQTLLPAYVITLAPEQEKPSGLGDNYSTYDHYDIGIGNESDDAEHQSPEDVIETALDDVMSSTFMDATYRIECWSDNGDLTAYMYTILKWCLWASREEMISEGWSNITLSGSDLEPVPDYMPIFIFRRAVQVSITYDNLYYENLERVNELTDGLLHNPRFDDKGNVVDRDGKVLVPASYTWLLRMTPYSGAREYTDDTIESTYRSEL